MFHSPGLRVLDSAPDLVSIMDGEGRFEFVNETHQRLLGLSPELLTGTSIIDIVHPDDRAAAAVGLHDAISDEGVDGPVPVRLRNADGGWTLFEVDGKRLPDEPVRVLLISRMVREQAPQGTAEMERISAMLRGQQAASPDGILVVSSQGETLSYNERFLEMWHLTREDVEAGYKRRLEKVYALLTDPTSTVELVENIYDRPRATFNHLVSLRDGRWLEMHTAPLTAHDGALLGRVWYYRDVSERIRAEAEIKASEERYRRLVELSPNGIGVHQGGVLRYINEAASRMLNVDRRAVIGRSVFDLIHPEDRDIVIGAAMRPDFEQPEFVEVRMVRPDGVILNVEVASSATQFDGRPATQTVLRDVTARREAERRLRESEERYRTLVENAPDPIFVHDGTRIRYANRAAAQFLGFGQAEDLIGLDPFELVRGVDRATFSERMGRVLSGETVRLSEHRHLVFAGREADLEITMTPATSSGEPLVQVILRDLTERRMAEEERLALERKILETQKLESLGVLAGGIAHDFNNLLVAIMGNAGLAMNEADDNSPMAPYLREIETAAQRAADLARQMLAYSGKGRLVVEPVNLSAIVREMVSLLSVSIPKNTNLEFAIDEAIPAFEGDPTQIRQVVMNLVINAAEAIGSAPGSIVVETGFTEVGEDELERFRGDPGGPGPYVFLRVSDTGAGMDAETVARVFDPFFTTKFTGRGLGLAAVLGIVRGHRGGINVESAPGEGTTFTLLLPPAHEPASRSAVEPESSPVEGYRVSALVVDDEAPVRKVAAKMLERLGMQVVTACDGQEALDYFREHGPAVGLVITDLTMPRLGGEALVEAIREAGSDVPAILMSGYNESEASGRSGRDARTRFLQKPFSLQDVEAAVSAVLAAPALE